MFLRTYRNGRAVGVEYVNEDDITHNKVIVNASRLVVIAAGAFGSPAILERSGIGSKDVLDKNGIPQIVDLPGVGEHYMGDCHSAFGSHELRCLQIMPLFLISTPGVKIWIVWMEFCEEMRLIVCAKIFSFF